MPILLLGATGTGKEMFAQAIHRWSRRPGRFMDINCGALPRDLVEGELFGHTRGAFTGAGADRPGLLYAASGGTLFLDELTSLPLETQVKLLRALETGHVRRLGESCDRKVEFRAVAAAQPDIHHRLENGLFRLDLFQRLAGLVIALPTLIERREDIIILARGFAQVRGCTLGCEAERPLLEYSWPGNVRELRSAIERASFLSNQAHLDEQCIEEAISLGMGGTMAERSGPTNRNHLSGRLLEEVCAQHQWQSEPIALALGVSRATLFRILRTKGLSLRKRGLIGAADSPTQRSSHRSWEEAAEDYVRVPA
jgi:DNA-binding NtrC family response regulator